MFTYKKQIPSTGTSISSWLPGKDLRLGKQGSSLRKNSCTDFLWTSQDTNVVVYLEMCYIFHLPPTQRKLCWWWWCIAMNTLPESRKISFPHLGNPCPRQIISISRALSGSLLQWRWWPDCLVYIPLLLMSWVVSTYCESGHRFGSAGPSDLLRGFPLSKRTEPLNR